MTLKITLTFLLTISLLAPTVAQQQKPPKQDEVVTIDTNLVQIDVVVTDKAGKQVTDLKPEDFEVSEDGKKRQLTHFSYIATGKASQPENVAANPEASIKTEAPVKPARLKREQVRRTVALVIDDLGLSFESFDFARKALAKFVDEQMQPTDMVAVLRTSAGVGVLQQFTSDKRQLHAAIDSVRWNPLGRGGLSPDGDMNEASINADNRENIQFTEELEESRAGMYSVGTIGTVSAIIKGMAEMPGRKSLLLISEAFQMFSAQGRNVQLIQELTRLTDEANANSVAIYTIDASGLQSYTFKASDKVAGYSYVIDPDVMAASGGPQVVMGPPSGSSFATAGRDLVGGRRLDTGSRARTLDRVDTTTAQSEQDSGAAFRRLQALSAMRDQQAGESHTVLSYLAQRTGGMFERNRNDLGTSIERIMQDQQGYYLIGFRPDESPVAKDGTRRLHDLKVKVKRSGLKVRSRAGYFGITDADRGRTPRTRDEQLKDALISPFASGDINIQLTSLFRDEPRGGVGFVRSLLYIDAKDLKFTKATDGTWTAELEMVAVAFGDNGRVVNQINYPQTVQAANDTVYQRMLEQGLVYILDCPLRKGGPYQMRVAVRDATSERTGAAMKFVEAPDLASNRLAMSGIVLSNAMEAAKSSAAEQDIRSGPAVRQLRQGMMIDYRFLIYNATTTAAEPVHMQMRLLRDGKPVFTGKLVPLDISKEPNPKRISTGGRLRLGPDLTPGDYVLHVAVKNTTDPKKPRVASQWIDFEIVN